MPATVDPVSLQLAPGETKTAVVKVTVPKRVPPGGHETRTLLATLQGEGAEGAPVSKISYVTASRLEHPNILHTADGWAQIRENVKKYDWAKQAQQEYVDLARAWVVSEVNNPVNPKRGDWLFVTNLDKSLMASGISYQLTGNQEFAQKVRTFLLRLSDPKTGFPVTRRACNQASVQEGGFFQNIAMAYDMTIPSGVYTEEDRRQIDQTLRLFVGDVEGDFGDNISNWAVAFQCGQLFSALALQDLAAADRILYGPGALIDQFVQGTLDDGWWYEVSISYNTWVATEFSQVAIAMRPWGVNLSDAWFQSGFRPDNVKPPHEEEYGMSRARWGPIKNSHINIKHMWDALPPVVDWHGVLFGLNDSAEKPIVGPQMDIAYYLYRDPAYATIIKRGGKRNLLYAVPELPENPPDRSLDSVCADNAGLAVLRSQDPSRPPSERIQAVLHYGDHGWYHGHFDITDLVHLSRYGRSFWNPEFIWYSYPSYLYKFYVQTSVSKNMVVVDQKMQEPKESERLLIHSGPMMQVAAVQVETRWANPPYGGMVYPDQSHSFPEKSFNEGRSIPIPQNPPPYGKFGSVTGYTEPVLQRRALIVADDYIVLADYLKGDKDHNYDALFQINGFRGLDAPSSKLLRHTAQWNPDPLGAAQFVTDCNWYEATAPARASFRYEFSPDKKNVTLENIPGVLNIDLHALWPAKQEIMIGTPPQSSQAVNKQVSYAVRGDGKILAEGRSGIWTLGQVDVDVPVENVKELQLEVKTTASKIDTLFWANARIVTADGKEIPLDSLPMTSKDTKQPADPGKDFGGGPIKIAGIPYEKAISAQPNDEKTPALTKVDLGGVKAVRFKATLGGDFPVGKETEDWKTVALRSSGKEARFLTLLEPFEKTRMIKSATASGPDSLHVELVDGRVQEIQLSNFEGDAKGLSVHMKETKGGKLLREESTTAGN